MDDQNAIKCDALEMQPGVLLIVFEGYYPPDSLGNSAANTMVKYSLAAYRQHSPKAILFDFENLDYDGGDAICGTALRLAVEREELPLSIPVSVLANGRTQRALEPLFGDKRAFFGLAGARLFQDRAEAMAYLENRF